MVRVEAGTLGCAVMVRTTFGRKASMKMTSVNCARIVPRPSGPRPCGPRQYGREGVGVEARLMELRVRAAF
ncbi:hypothetical protein GCM10008959_02790 [Deinococcus seoulensis]|uniref:Uncharacterized protein n=1 Tax=Deinococcus seoulensis TaxID=1837379 RepID=A0ABQ2RKT4_9DEIO|nr:hypothetical protein GCM10008959_02790 [Deinococcus seoulensis]